MRINLQVRFEEKDHAKRLGARWDPSLGTWYIVDMEDLTPFMRWIPVDRANPGQRSAEVAGMITLAEFIDRHYPGNSKALTAAAAKAWGIPYPLKSGWYKDYAEKAIPISKMQAIHKKVGSRQKKHKKHAAEPVAPVAHVRDVQVCNCNVQPWEDCEHTEAAASQAMQEMLA